MRNNYIYLLVMFAVSYAIRTTPLTLLRRPLENRFLRSFLHYVPYVTLAVMTFPAILTATDSPLSALAALLVGLGVAWWGGGLFPVAAACCAAVYVVELLL